MNVVSCGLIFDESSQKFRLSQSKSSLGLGKGLYDYQWIVSFPAGGRKVLCGVSRSISDRLSAYISEFNREVPKSFKALHALVQNTDNRVAVSISGPHDEGVDVKELEETCIEKIPAEERLNKTRGGNGGGAWDQYDDLPPSRGVFSTHETPKKYYPFIRKKDHIAPQLTPSAKNSGIYKFKRTDETESQYIGMSSDVAQRIRVHASKASCDADASKLAHALSQSPEKFVVGIFPSTLGKTPRTLRSAEKHHIEKSKPKLNSNRGGGGPTLMKKRKAPEKDTEILKEFCSAQPAKKKRRQ